MSIEKVIIFVLSSGSITYGIEMSKNGTWNEMNKVADGRKKDGLLLTARL
jgi:hypothetical protein